MKVCVAGARTASDDTAAAARVLPEPIKRPGHDAGILGMRQGGHEAGDAEGTAGADAGVGLQEEVDSVGDIEADSRSALDACGGTEFVRCGGSNDHACRTGED